MNLILMKQTPSNKIQNYSIKKVDGLMNYSKYFIPSFPKKPSGLFENNDLSNSKICVWLFPKCSYQALGNSYKPD